MVTSEEVIERSFYISLLYETLLKGLTINPDDYLVDGVPTEETLEKYETDKKAIGNKFVYVFGIGNNQERGIKDCPRITVELKAYYPGGIGMGKYELEKSEDETYYQTSEYDYTSKDTQIDIHLVANTQAEMRVLHDIMYRALPARGYLKPYYNDFEAWKSTGLQPYGNLYIEVGNFYDHPNLEHGLLEKVYTYVVQDSLVLEDLMDITWVPIKDISVLIQPEGTDGVLLEVP